MNRVTENPNLPFQPVKIRGFEVARGWRGLQVHLPERATSHSAGYDFRSVTTVVIPVADSNNNKPTLVPTGVKAYMRPHEVLILANRSSNPKKGLLLANGIGVIDADYYGNPDNDGHIMFAFWNVGDEPVTIKFGDKIGQGIFTTYLRADGTETMAERRGGFGSTDL